MRAASAATATRLAAAATGIVPAKPVSYTILNELRLTTGSQLVPFGVSGASNTGTAATSTDAPIPGGATSQVRVSGPGYNGTSFGVVLPTAWDMSNGNFRFQMRTDTLKSRGGFQVRLAASKAAHDAGNYLIWSVTPGFLQQNVYSWEGFSPLLATTVGTATSLSSIGYVVFTFADYDGSTTSVYDIARIQNVRNDGVKAKCVIWHDDSATVGADGIWARMSAYGWAAEEATIWGNLVAGSATSIFPAAKYQADGWALASHSNLSAEHTNVSLESVQSQAIRNKTASMVFAGRGEDMAYWGGLSSAMAYPAIQRLYRSGRSYVLGATIPELQPPSDLHYLKALGANASDTFDASLKPLVDRAIAVRGIAQVVYHQDIGPNANGIMTPEFDKLLAYLDQQRANIDVVTLSSALDALSVGYSAPTLPPTPMTLIAIPGGAQVTLNRLGGYAPGAAFKLYRGTTATGTPIATSLPFTDTGLTNGTEVSYVATSTNSFGTVTSNVLAVTPNVPVVDTFDRADSTTSLGTASDSGTWSILAGTWGIASNLAYSTAAGGIAVRDTGNADHYAQVTQSAAAYGSLIFRCTDVNNFYQVYVNPSGQYQIAKRVAGVDSFVKNLSGAGLGDTLRVQAKGSAITIWRNGIYVDTIIDASLPAGTKAGLAAGTGPRFDNFAAGSIAAAPLPVIANTVRPTVSGSSAVGQTLTGTNGTWTPTPASYSYQWYRNGAAISGATTSTYTTVSADTGTTVALRVTAKASGYQDTGASSAGIDVGATHDPASVTGLVARFRANDLTGLTTGSAFAVWPDTSGSGYDATALDANARPVWVANVVNGKPVVRFAATSGTAYAGKMLASDLPAGPAAQTMVVIMQTAADGLVKTFRAGVANNGLTYRINGNKLEMVKRGIAILATDTPTVPAAFAVVAFQYDSGPATYKFVTNGTVGASAVKSIGQVAGKSTIGGDAGFNAEPFVGDIAEILVWNRSLTASELAVVDSYAKDYYGITVSDYA